MLNRSAQSFRHDGQHRPTFERLLSTIIGPLRQNSELEQFGKFIYIIKDQVHRGLLRDPWEVEVMLRAQVNVGRSNGSPEILC